MNINKAAEYIYNHSKGTSQGLCARYVANGLVNAGLKFNRQPSAYLYNLELPIRGFKKISLTKYSPIIGDIVVFDRNKFHPYGHIAMWTGKNWTSDFRQRNMNPYKNQASAGTATIWRYVNG